MGKWEIKLIFRGPSLNETKSKQGDRLHDYKFFTTGTTRGAEGLSTLGGKMMGKWKSNLFSESPSFIKPNPNSDQTIYFQHQASNRYTKDIQNTFREFTKN